MCVCGGWRSWGIKTFKVAVKSDLSFSTAQVDVDSGGQEWGQVSMDVQAQWMSCHGSPWPHRALWVDAAAANSHPDEVPRA